MAHKLMPVQQAMRVATRALVTATHRAGSAAFKQRIATIALDTYNLATEYDGGFRMTPDDRQMLKDAAAWTRPKMPGEDYGAE